MDDELPDWHVLGNQVRKDTTLADSGSGLQTVFNVPFQIDSGPARGAIHSVDVGPDDLTEDRVQQAIEEHLNNLHRVAQLGKGNA